MLLTKYVRQFFDFLLRSLSKEDVVVTELESMSPKWWHDKIQVQILTETTLYFFSYQNTHIKRAILEIKKHNNQKILNSMIEACSEHLQDELSERKLWNNFNPEILIPIPASTTSKDFNHSAEIARTLAQKFPSLMFCPEALKKIRSTTIQHSLSRQKRLMNLRHSMHIKDSAFLRNKDIILIDDVTTTGATFIEAMRALREAQAGKILCIALAH